MKTLDEIRAFFQDDRFASTQGISIDEVGHQGAVCSVAIEDRHKNAMGRVQGGLVFTLADFAFAVAANYENLGTMTLTSSISFLASPKGNKLIATATPVHNGRSTCHYTVEVRDDGGGLIAMVSSTGFRRAHAARGEHSRGDLEK